MGKKIALAVLGVLVASLLPAALFADEDYRSVLPPGKYYLIPHPSSDKKGHEEDGEQIRSKGYKESAISDEEDREAAFYKSECGSCHMAYPPELLPKRSWEKMMASLEDHFGTDAELDREDMQRISAFLAKNSSDSKPIAGEFQEIAEGIASYETPLRISDTYYFKKEHRKIPQKLIVQKEVKSISNCNACHTKAEQGSFSEKEIAIPNYGAWDD